DLVAVLWTGCTWRSLAHLLTGGLLWLAQLLAVVLLLTPVRAKRAPLGHGPDAKPLRITVAAVLLLLVLPGLAALTSVFTRWQRARFRAFLGVELAPFGPGRNWPAWRRQLAYHALAGPFNALAGAAVVLGLVAGPAIVARSLNSLMGRGRLALPFGCALILAALWVARGAAAVDAGMARALLQPPAAEVLARRVATLSASRAAAVDAADAERRRIERDLHDGTQQRLVSLAMTLGMTRTAVRDAGPEVRQAVADAHE